MRNLYTQTKQQNAWELAGMILGVLLLLSLVLLYPFAVIWAINTLFIAMVIPYNFWSWLSVVILGLFVRQVNIKKS
jgi:hypothetical protein